MVPFPAQPVSQGLGPLGQDPRPDAAFVDAAGSSSISSALNESLNTDPFNLCAEEQALAACIHDRPVRRIWSERELVRTFGGAMTAGTPDGMFELWDATLTCVQVVRAPWRRCMGRPQLAAALEYCVLTKVVKSQAWLKASASTPHAFVVFVWLPFDAPDCVGPAHDLMHRVRQLDPRFRLELAVPAAPADLFPPLFATSTSLRKASSQSFSEADLCSEDELAISSDSDDWECPGLWDDEGWLDPG